VCVCVCVCARVCVWADASCDGADVTHSFPGMHDRCSQIWSLLEAGFATQDTKSGSASHRVQFASGERSAMGPRGPTSSFLVLL
jgi:hypothetical protein